MLITNFRLIKAGVLHRANGGFLLLDLRSLLSETFSWPTLKRALLQRQIVIEDLTHSLGFSSTVTLEPDPIPLDIKVVLFCDRQLYEFLSAVDPEVNQHFKVLADFDDDITRTASSEEDLSRSIASMARREGIRPIDRGGLERMLEYSSRLAGDQQKLTLVMDQIRDLAVEADFWAGNAKHDEIARADVEYAIDQRIQRGNRVDQHRKEAIYRRISLIDTSGSREGQVNGLSVFNMSGHSFGTPTRITCRVRPGSGKIIDIEREVELGGPIHSKGVLILSGFLAGRYALETPMSLYASIVLEQSYGGVEGDSASAAELCALLSALAAVPLRQDCALTGSVNQLGDIQAIGGVNEKIEGFFDICLERGLTGTQCVIIPASNAQHLMLRSDIIAACAEERFSVYTVSSIDDAIELLTGLTAGLRDEKGRYPEGSVNRRVEDRLIAFSQKLDALHRDGARAGLET
jgi:predicted ATP-dependent protease